MDPPRDGALLDVDDGRESAMVRPDPRDGRFARTDGAHVELVFRSAGEVLAFVEGVHRSLAVRLVPVPRDAVMAYVRARLDAHDPEWTAFVADAPKGERWR